MIKCILHKRNLSDYKCRNLENAMWFFYEEYFKRFTEKITVNIRFNRVTDIDYDKQRNEFDGGSAHKIRKNLYNVTLYCEETLKNLISTVFHELYHVYDYIIGNLKNYKDKTYYKGYFYEEMNKMYEQTLTDEEYETIPWEKPAFKAEDKMYFAFIEKYRL